MGVTHVVWLPDSETSFLYEEMVADPSLHLVQVAREGESIGVALGLWVGGKKPVVLIQNTGLFESGDSVRSLAVDSSLPIVLMVGYRGYTRHGVTPDFRRALHGADRQRLGAGVLPGRDGRGRGQDIALLRAGGRNPEAGSLPLRRRVEAGLAPLLRLHRQHFIEASPVALLAAERG